MNIHKHIKSGVRPVLLLAFLSLTAPFVYAQDISNSEEETKPNLELKLTSITPSLCIDSELSLELGITNVSHEDVVVDMSKLWTQFSYGFNGEPDQFEKAGGMGITNSDKNTQLVVLYPGNSVRSTFDFRLANEFFQAIGNYKLRTSINSIFSNEVKFTLHNCGKSLQIEEKL